MDGCRVVVFLHVLNRASTSNMACCENALAVNQSKEIQRNLGQCQNCGKPDSNMLYKEEDLVCTAYGNENRIG